MRNILRVSVFVLLLFPHLTGFAQFCSNDHRFSEAEYYTDAQIDSLKNVPYGYAIDWQGAMDTLLMDFYFPDTTIDPLPLRPAVVIIHGGGFQIGNKASWRKETIAFAKRGYVAITINYRLGWNTAQPFDQVLAMYRAQQDAHAALRFIVNQADSLRIDPDWLFIGGGSAVAITSLNTVYADQAEWNTLIPGIETLLGSLDTSGNSLTDTFSLNGIFNNWGAINYSLVQPQEMVPMASFHGDQDLTVLIDSGMNGLIGSRVIHDALVANGVCSDLLVKPGGGHGIYRDANGINLRVGRASCLFKSVFCNNCTSFYSTDSIPAECSLLTSFPDEGLPQKVTVYPNPFETGIQLEGLLGDEELVLYNISGQMVGSGEEWLRIGLTSLPKGMYLLVIRRNGDTQSIRLVK